MNKLVLFIVLICVFINPVKAQTVYGINIKSINGQIINLSSHQGKKIMFIVLSGNAADSAIVNQVATFKENNSSQIEIIATPSIEKGFTTMSEATINSLYKRNGIFPMLLSEGMYVNKSSGVNQAELFKWLTLKGQNGHFDQDVKGAGQKFFVDESGVLYAVIGPEISLSAPVIEKILNR